MECLPDSTLPTELRKAGYDVREIEDGERIPHSAVTEHFTLTSSGAFEPLSPNSTKTIAETVRHAGIVKVRRFAFEIP